MSFSPKIVRPVLRTVKSVPTLRSKNLAASGATTFVRNLHESTPSTNPSNLLSTSTTYTSQSVSALRAECKKRGLKVSGRKAELIDRLMSRDAIDRTRQFSATPKTSAKGDSSSIDYFRLPPEHLENNHEYGQQAKMSIKIPILPHVAKTAKTVEGEYDAVPPNDGGAAANPEHSGTEDAIPLRSMGFHEVSSMENVHRVVRGEASSRDKPYESAGATSGGGGGGSSGRGAGGTDAELSERDRWFLTGFAGVVAGWWLLGSKSKKSKH